jgi:diguanylate cyclase (GGDEF)-like protein/PAS domain S-box-containing protein
MTGVSSITSQSSKAVSAVLIAVVAVGVLLSLLMDWRTFEVNMQSVARERGAALFRLVELTRSWNAKHGGVYVPVTEATQPNLYLEHKRRDVTTQDGIALTMINPAFMTRQISEIAEQTNGVRLHITSNKPIRPENKADDWEAAALTRFENGVSEIIEFIPGEQPIHRYMAPLRVQTACMSCHRKQGYEVGQIRGGISVTMPAAELLALRDGDRVRSLVGHVLVFGIVAGLLHLLMSRTRGHLHALESVNLEQEQIIAERTRSLSEANTELEREVEEREVAAAVFDNVAEAIMVVDANGLIMQVNPSFTQMTGYRESEALGMDVTFLKSSHHPPEFFADMMQTLHQEGRWQGEIWNRRRTGEVFAAWLSIARVAGTESSKRYVATLSDITLRKELEDQLRHLAYHDSLTDLPNRALFKDRLLMAITQSLRHKRLFAVCFIDLDHFKAVNDTLGHGAGDRLLIEAAGRLRTCVRESDSLARLGGDEFAAILTELASVDEVNVVAARMVQELARPFELGVGTGKVSASIGIAVFPEHGGNMEALQLSADAALYRVKEGGRNGFKIFSPT